MNTFTILTIVLLVVVVAILIKIFILNKKNNSMEDKDKIEFDQHLLKVKLPDVVKVIEQKELRAIATEQIKTYRSLGYGQRHLVDMQDLDWHSWQVSIVIKMYKENMDLFIHDYKKIFPKEIVNESAYSLGKKLFPIFNKYNKAVSVGGSRKYLYDQIIWSSYDMSVLLLFLTKYKNSSE